MNAPEEMRAYWMPHLRFFDETGPATAKLQLAVLVHQLVFEGQLLLESGDIVNNLTLREMARENKLLKNLAMAGHLRVLFAEDGHCRNLQALATYVNATGSRREHITEDRFLISDDLESLAAGGLVTFKLSEYRQFYAPAILETIDRAESFGDLEREIAAAMREYLEIEKESGQPLGVSFFKKHRLGRHLEAAFPGRNAWEEYYGRLRLISWGPALAFWNKKFSANPCYGPEHAKAVSYFYGGLTVYRTEPPTSHVIRSRLGADSYVEGLAALLPEDVEEILNCSERARYRLAVLNMTEKESSAIELRSAFEELRLRLEAAISRRVLGLPKRKQSRVVLTFQRFEGRYPGISRLAGATVRWAVLQIADAALFGIPSLVLETAMSMGQKGSAWADHRQRVEATAEKLEEDPARIKDRLEVTKSFWPERVHDSLIRIS